MPKPEIYVSTDVEATGPIPGPYSMLSFGSVAFNTNGDIIDTFERNLKELPDAIRHPKTMEFWDVQKEAWEYCRKNTVEPRLAMCQYSGWLTNLPGKPVFVGYPAGFDFLYIYWYLINFTGYSPFSFSALDIKTYAMAMLGTNFRQTVKRRMPREWFTKTPHNHKAIDDALGQGEMFMNMLKINLARIESC